MGGMAQPNKLRTLRLLVVKASPALRFNVCLAAFLKASVVRHTA